MNDDEVKPQPKRRHRPVAELRRVVSARHKVLASDKPAAEAIKLILDEYGTDLSSAENFVTWLRGGTLEPPKPPVERVHIVCDPETGIETRIETEPGSIPPRPL